MKKSDFYKLGAIFVFAYLLRVMFLPQNALTFGYDQARDAFVTQQILAGDIKILGPPASTPGLFHGVFYYYFLAPAYFLSKNPIVAAYWTALFNAAAVFVVFLITYLATKRKAIAFLSSILFAVSFEASQYAVWLSNPTLGVWTVPLIYLGLWLWIDSKNLRRIGAILCALGLGLSIQAEIFLLYHAVPVLFWLIVSRKKIKINDFLVFLVVGAATLSTMIMVEIKFGFKGLSGIFNLFTAQDSIVQKRQLGDYLVLFLNQIGKTFSGSLFPTNAGYGGALGLFVLIYAIRDWLKKKKKDLFSWQLVLTTYVLAHLTVVSVGGVSTPFLLVGIGTGIAILSGIVFYKLWESKKVIGGLIIATVIISNIIMIFFENPKGQTIFAIQNDMLLSKQFEVLDYTYEQANGEDFSINTITSPLWVNNVWAYLYNWYGEGKYGYKPQWHGRDQVGQLADGVLSDVSEQTKTYFLIQEPLQGIPMFFVNEAKDSETQYGEILELKHFGEMNVEKRILEREDESRN